MTININPNSDCAGELDLLKDLLRRNTRYAAESLSYAAIVSIAVDELYDRLIQEQKAGINQRTVL